jgi:two-component system sensor histidine kinase DctS
VIRWRWLAAVEARRWVLWGTLLLLVVVLLSALAWLALRYEKAQMQDQLERDTVDAVGDVRAAMQRNVQTLQALQPEDPSAAAWVASAEEVLRYHREWVRLEWRDPALQLRVGIDSVYRTPVFARLGRDNALADIAQACALARRTSAAAYAPSTFVSVLDGQGLEVMELCLPVYQGGQLAGFLVASYALVEMLEAMVRREHTRAQEVSFTEPDGTRLALRGGIHRGPHIFSAQQMIDLPGYALVLRLDSWRASPNWFPNLLTALVLGLSLALVTVLALLARDMRRRQRAERDLADALAFRKAMEDSLVTGLRARDLQGRITYVNPAFCEMVGFAAEELLGQGIPAPYWPPEKVDEYGKRQAWRLAGNTPPREGTESDFQRKNGERFPVLIFEAPLINASGTQTGWMSAVLDISAQRASEELSRATLDRLQATARLATVGEMASLLSHELNQPLAAIASYASGSQNLLQADVSMTATMGQQLGQALEHIADQARRAGLVIKSVHNFVRRRDHAREAVAAHSLVDSILPLVTLQARKTGVRLHVDCPSDLPAVWCDRTMVEQVLLNLARNGMQAMQDLPTGRVRDLRIVVRPSTDPGEGLVFSIADGGLGISAEVSSQLFTPFFTTKAEGMGLGLSLCRTVVEQHGARLQHRALASGGTEFYFSLALAPQDQTHSTGVPALPQS